MATPRRRILEEAKLIQTAGGDLGAEWAASVPDTFTAEEGISLADRALSDAKKVVRDVKFSFRGTLPPPPWPAPPELVAAMDHMEAARDFFAVVDERKKDTKFPKASTTIRTGPTFVAIGIDLYKRADQLQQKAAAAETLPEILKLIPDPRRVLFGITLPVEAKVAVGVGVAAYLFLPSVRRAVRRIIPL